MLELLVHYEERAKALLSQGLPVYRIQEMKINLKLATMKHEVPDDKLEELDKIKEEMDAEFDQLEQGLARPAEVRG